MYCITILSIHTWGFHKRHTHQYYINWISSGGWKLLKAIVSLVRRAFRYHTAPPSRILVHSFFQLDFRFSNWVFCDYIISLCPSLSFGFFFALVPDASWVIASHGSSRRHTHGRSRSSSNDRNSNGNGNGNGTKSQAAAAAEPTDTAMSVQDGAYARCRLILGREGVRAHGDGTILCGEGDQQAADGWARAHGKVVYVCFCLLHFISWRSPVEISGGNM